MIVTPYPAGISPPFLFVSLIPIWIFLPQKPLDGDFSTKVRQIDFLGSLLSMAGSIFLLVRSPYSVSWFSLSPFPGAYLWRWHYLCLGMLCASLIDRLNLLNSQNSAIVIAMLTISIVIIGMFLAVQAGFAQMPLLPLRIFRYRTVALVFASVLCQGWIHYGQIFYLPVRRPCRVSDLVDSSPRNVSYIFKKSWDILVS